MSSMEDKGNLSKLSCSAQSAYCKQGIAGAQARVC